MRQRRSWGNVAEVMLDFRLGGFDVDVTGQNERRVVWPVVRLKPLAYVFQGRRVQIVHRADDVPRVRVPGREEIRDDLLEYFPVRLVVALALLVLHDAPLLVELLLVDRGEQMAHAVGFHPQSEVHGGARDGLEVVRAIEIRRAVHAGGAHLLKRPEVLVVVIFGAIEHQVLEQVGETCLARHFVL